MSKNRIKKNYEKNELKGLQNYSMT